MSFNESDIVNWFMTACKGDAAAFYKLLYTAEIGNVTAQYYSGAFYDSRSSGRDAVQAAHWYRKAAEQGHAGSQFLLAVMYNFGDGVPQDDGLATQWLFKAAENGEPTAQFNLAGRLEEAGAEYSEESKYWLRKAANNGQATAQFILGMRYDEGIDLPKDAAKAVYWYREAAEQGKAMAQGSLGAMYTIGRGVPRDLVLAYMWRNLAAAQGDETSKTARIELESVMTPNQIAEAQKLSREWKPKK
jgi:TPR repeat protein